VEVTTDKEDSRSLNITIKKTSSNITGKPEIVLNSVFTFDDHIRCMAAKQHLVKARDRLNWTFLTGIMFVKVNLNDSNIFKRARRMKLEKIAQLLDITLNNNMSSSKNMMTNSGSSSDIISYNLVAGNFFEKNYFVRL
jgi:hypothetical protein